MLTEITDTIALDIKAIHSVTIIQMADDAWAVSVNGEMVACNNYTNAWNIYHEILTAVNGSYSYTLTPATEKD